MDDILSSEDELLTSGYAGTQVISVKLDTLGDARRKRQTEPELGTAQNDTATKECKVIVTIHVQFDGIGEMSKYNCDVNLNSLWTHKSLLEFTEG